MSGAKLDATHPPKGWELIPDGEKIKIPYLFWCDDDKTWEKGIGADSGHTQGDGHADYPHARKAKA